MQRNKALFWNNSLFPFISAGTQVSEQIGEFRSLQLISKGWHAQAAADDLLAHLDFIQPSADTGQVGRFAASGMVDGVAMHASAGSE
jgi:hypothetical protein